MPPLHLSPMPAGPVLLAVHSSAASGRQWDAWRRQAPHDATWHTPDLLGYGVGAWSPAAPVSLQREAEALAPLLHTAPHGMHLVGHSYGGAVALEMALRWPQHVRSLTLYEPMRPAVLRGAQPDDHRVFRAFAGFGRGIGAAVLRGQDREAARQFVDYWSGEGTWASLPSPRQQAIAARMAKVAAEFSALCSDRPPIHALRRLDVPVSLLCGTRSPAPALQVVERLYRMLPWVTLQRLDGLGHLGPIEAPARVAACMALNRGWQTAPLAA